MTRLDRRRTERYAIGIPALIEYEVKTVRESVELLTKDVCSGGASFHTDSPMPLGTSVAVSLSLPRLRKSAADRALINVNGSVIRVGGQSMVICFKKKYTISAIRGEDGGSERSDRPLH